MRRVLVDQALALGVGVGAGICAVVATKIDWNRELSQFKVRGNVLVLLCWLTNFYKYKYKHKTPRRYPESYAPPPNKGQAPPTTPKPQSSDRDSDRDSPPASSSDWDYVASEVRESISAVFVTNEPYQESLGVLEVEGVESMSARTASPEPLDF